MAIWAMPKWTAIFLWWCFPNCYHPHQTLYHVVLRLFFNHRHTHNHNICWWQTIGFERRKILKDFLCLNLTSIFRAGPPLLFCKIYPQSDFYILVYFPSCGDGKLLKICINFHLWDASDILRDSNTDKRRAGLSHFINTRVWINTRALLKPIMVNYVQIIFICDNLNRLGGTFKISK